MHGITILLALLLFVNFFISVSTDRHQKQAIDDWKANYHSAEARADTILKRANKYQKQSDEEIDYLTIQAKQNQGIGQASLHLNSQMKALLDSAIILSDIEDPWIQDKMRARMNKRINGINHGFYLLDSLIKAQK